jgi:hypothetical protein
MPFKYTPKAKRRLQQKKCFECTTEPVRERSHETIILLRSSPGFPRVKNFHVVQFCTECYWKRMEVVG